MTAPLDLCVCGHYRANHGADQSLTSTTARCTHCSCSYFETVEDAEKYSHRAEFIDGLLSLTAEFRRVLAPHGSIAVELGDTFSGSGGAGGDYNEDGMRARSGSSTVVPVQEPD
jgi:hypothetical protein